jgi:NAD+ kinase
MRIGIYGRSFNKEHAIVYQRIIKGLARMGCTISVYRDLWKLIKGKFDELEDAEIFSSHKDIAKKTDFIFSIGGDGTLLNTITLVRDSGIPVLGFNTGRLGFLSSVNREEISKALNALKAGKYETEQRSLISLQTDKKIFGDENFALNEVCIHRKDAFSMISIHAYVDDIFLNTYWADGLIIATPTGSTAYSLSCGGPIVTPDSQNFIISPVSTHNLTVRPIVVPDLCTIRLSAEGREDKFQVSLDSRAKTIDSSTELIIRKHPYPISLVKLPGANFFSTIREKLMWGMDKRN